MIDEQQVDELETQESDDLRALIQNSVEVSEAVFLSDPVLAEDAGFEPFSSDWISRYWRSLGSQISGKPIDQTLDWALKATAVQVSTALVVHFGISVVAYPAAIALAILLLRAAKDANKQPSEDESEPE